MAIQKKETKEPVKKTQTKTTTRKAPVKKAAKKEVDLQKQVPVVNMAQASLTYSAKKGNGYLQLDNYLDTDYMTIEDLQVMKNSARGVFEKGWLLIDDQEAVEFLGLQKLMDKILSPEELEGIFEMNPDNLKEELKGFSASIKENVYQAMKIKYADGELTNAHIIRAIEDSLNIDKSLSVLNI